MNYYVDIHGGNVVFSDLAAGTYYIGYFFNGSNQLISKQVPFMVVEHEFLVVNSDYKERDE